MLNAVQIGTRTVNGATVRVHADTEAMARAAADEALGVMRAAVEARGIAHVMFATGNSQLAFVARWSRTAGVPWADTVVFHMDEYVGVGPDHPAGSDARSVSASWSRPSEGGPLRRRARRPLGRVLPLRRALAVPSARPVLPRHRRERAPRLQRPTGGRLRRSARRQGGRARDGLPDAAGQRRSLSRPGRRPDACHHGDHPGAAAGRPGDGHRARGAEAEPVRDA